MARRKKRRTRRKRVGWTRECRRVRYKGRTRTVCRSKKSGKIQKKRRPGTKARKRQRCSRVKIRGRSRMVCRRPDGRFARGS